MWLLNAISLQMIPADCFPSMFIMEEIPVEKARELLGENFKSAVGHADTAAVVSGLLGRPVPEARVTVTLAPGEEVVVAQLVGGRLPAGATTIPPGMEMKFIRVTLKKIVKVE